MEELDNKIWARLPDMHKYLEGRGKIESAVNCILPATTFNGPGLLKQEGYDGVYSYGTNANVAVVTRSLFVEGPYVKGALGMEPDLKIIRNIHLLKLEKL